MIELALLAALTCDGTLAQNSSLSGASNVLSAQARSVASSETGWPQWRGPKRDGISTETGLLPSWPASGPRLLWKAEGLGKGYSGPTLGGDRIYLTGEIGEELRVFALDLSGRPLWEARHGAAWSGPYPGARGSCTFSEGRVYVVNAHGRVACLEAASGREVWAFTMFERFGGKNINWAVSENLLVDGPRVIITPGGTQALMAALNKATGETVWKTEPLRLGRSPSPAMERLAEPEGAADACSYASPILIQREGGRREIVGCSMRHVFGVDADTGALLWTRAFATRYSVIAGSPVLTPEGIFVTAPDTANGGKLFRVRSSGGATHVDTVWSTLLDTCHGGVVHVDGTLYGSWYRRQKGWAAVDLRSGRVRYQRNDVDQGSVLWADGRLYCLTQEGEMLLMKPTETGFETTGQFRLVPEGQEDVWAHPAIHNRRLYLRHHDALFCYDIAVGLLEAEP